MLMRITIEEREEKKLKEEAIRMYDIHCHILPGVDDGADNIDEAVMMAMMAKNSGVKAIFATPHYIEGFRYNNAVFNKNILEYLNSELYNRNIDIRIYIGNEVYLTFDLLELLEKEQIATLNNSNYMLIELPMYDIPMYIESIIYNLKLKGIIPIIAHPERNAKIIENPNILYKLIMKGALAQLNLPSLLGIYGKNVKNTAEILVKHNMIHFAGTDAHKPCKRYYVISEAIDTIISLIGREKTLIITKINPEGIITGANIEISEPKLYRKRW